MKTLPDHTLIYDEECPLCQVYTSAFIKTGMLDNKGRVSYTDLASKGIDGIDWDRARNEIALVNKSDQTITYGNDSLLRIIGYNCPLLVRFFNVKAIRYMLDQLYLFISFNRKVIAPGRTFEGKNRCTPDLNYSYRWAYIIITWIITSLVISKLSFLKSGETAPNLPGTILAMGGLLIFQATFVSRLSKKRVIHYLGNLMTVCLIGSIMAYPLIILDPYIGYKQFYYGYLLVVGLCMLREHFRRARILELPLVVSGTLILYPLVILFIIIAQS